MHPLLVNFSIFTGKSILEMAEKAIYFFEELELIPCFDCDMYCNCDSWMFCWLSLSRKLEFI